MIMVSGSLMLQRRMVVMGRIGIGLNAECKESGVMAEKALCWFYANWALDCRVL